MSPSRSQEIARLAASRSCCRPKAGLGGRWAKDLVIRQGPASSFSRHTTSFQHGRVCARQDRRRGPRTSVARTVDATPGAAKRRHWPRFDTLHRVKHGARVRIGVLGSVLLVAPCCSDAETTVGESKSGDDPDSAVIRDAGHDAAVDHAPRDAEDDAPPPDARVEAGAPDGFIYGACYELAGITSLEIQRRDPANGTCLRILLRDGGSCALGDLSGWCVRFAAVSSDLASCGTAAGAAVVDATAISGTVAFPQSDLVQVHAVVEFPPGASWVPSEAHIELDSCSIASCSFTSDCRVL